MAEADRYDSSTNSQSQQFLGSQDWTLSQALQMEDDQDDFITKFQDLTGIEKREMSRNYFEKSKDHYGNWNLEDALSMFYDDSESNFSQNDSMLPMANDNYFDLEFFIKTGDAGFYEIAINICSNLGLNDMKRMREVNKTIKKFMDEERMVARLLTKPIIFRPEVLSAHDLEEFNRWIEFISVVKKEGTLPELFSLIPINRKYVCIEPNFLPISPLKVAVTLKSKEILKMLKKYGLMDSEEKPELTVKFMKYACQALKWAQRDGEVKREIYHEGKYLNEFSVGLAASHGALIDPEEPIKVLPYLIRLMNQIELDGMKKIRIEHIEPKQFVQLLNSNEFELFLNQF